MSKKKSKGEDGRLQIVPDQADAVRMAFDLYLSGYSISRIKQRFEEQHILTSQGKEVWANHAIQAMIRNEKYCGDVLLQKTYTQDCLTKKKVKNNGQLPKYLIQNHHLPIIDRQKFDCVQAEIARRAGRKANSEKTSKTGMGKYSSKFALSERLVCGECGTLYRRCTNIYRGEKRRYWRCINRLDYGKKYCHKSPTMDEASLHRAILDAIEENMGDHNETISLIATAMNDELLHEEIDGMSIPKIEKRMKELEEETMILMSEAGNNIEAYQDQFKRIMDEAATLKERRKKANEQGTENREAIEKIQQAVEVMQALPADHLEWDEGIIRQLIDTVIVLAKDRIKIRFIGGDEVEHSV